MAWIGEGANIWRVHGSVKPERSSVVVTDVMMPVLGGVEMVGCMRLLAPEVPVVLVSGFTAEDRGLPLDAHTVFVPKPYTLTALCDAIHGVVAA